MVTSEKNKMLAAGESLRENPKTIWLSVPVLGGAIILAKLTGNKEAEAGGSGHLGLTFRLIYKHQWKQPLLLDVAYALFKNAARIGTGGGQPSVRMAMGGVALEKNDPETALEDYRQGYSLAKRLKDANQAAFLQSHMGMAETRLGDLASAKRDVETAVKTLYSALKKNPNSLYLQVWTSNAEIGMSEWYLATGDKKKAKLWAEKVQKRAESFELKTRKLDAEKLLKRIAAAGIALAVIPLRFVSPFLGKITVW